MSRGSAEAGGADAPWGPRWNFALRAPGSHGRVQRRGRTWAQTSLLLSPRMRPYPSASVPAASGFFLPWSPGPHASPAHRGSGLRPPRAPSAAPLRKHRRRHLPLAAVTLRTRRTCMAAGKWSPRSRPTPAPASRPASGLPPCPRLLAAVLRFRPPGAVPSGKCSPWAEAQDGK